MGREHRWRTRADAQPRAGTQGADNEALARRSVFNFVGLAAANALQFLLVLVLSHQLDQRAAGVFFEGFAAIRLLSVLSAVGLDIAAIRYVAVHLARDEQEEARAAVRLSVVAATLASVGVAAITFALAPWLAAKFGTTELQFVLRMMVIALPAIVLQMVLIGATRGTGRMVAFVAIDQIFDGVARTAAVSVALFIGWGLHGAATAFTFSAYLTLAAAAMSARGLLGAAPHGRAALAGLMRFSSLQWGASLAGVGLLWADTLLLGLWRSPADVAVYSIATRTVLMGLTFILPIGIAFQPQIGRFHALSDRSGLQSMYTFATKWSTLVGCPPLLFLALFATPVMTALYAGSYARGAWPLALLALGQTANAATGPCGHIVTMTGRADLVLQNSVAALILNVALNLVLIPPYGMTGAGLAWGISVVVWNLIRLLQVRSVLRMHPFHVWPRPVGAALAMFVIAAAASRVALSNTPAVADLSIGAIVATAVYAATLVTTRALDERDEAWLPGRLSRLVRAKG